MKSLKQVLSLAFMATLPAVADADVLINEVMQSNVYTIMDDINEFPDSWLELYNTSDQAVSLEGYRIGTSKSADKAYSLPALILPGGGYRLIYCDKVGDKAHTDFRIDSGKGDLYLFDADGKQIDHVSLKKQPAPDVAYGRKSDGADKWGYQLSPTPGAANTSGTSDVVLGQVCFSQPGFVHHSRITTMVDLEVPDGAPEGTYIRYTTDGSEPTLTNGNLYTKTLNLRTSTVVRAKAFCDGCISIPSNAESYIFLGRDIKIPIISIAVNSEYLYDYRIGIFADGPGGQGHENYRYDWRRPINLEYFEGHEDAEASINQLCETRVQGGWTRSNKLKSLALYANKRFGTKRFEYELWAKDKPGVTDNKSFILRNGGNDFGWCYVRDGLMQRVIGRNTDIDWQGYSPAIVYINGEYHGMLAVRERSNEDNIVANYHGLEAIDMFENWCELKAGDTTARDYLFDEFIKQEHSLDEWAQVINIESFTNLMAINYWVYNTDFPHNNTVMWRRTDGTDGRWQWLIKDCDFGLGIWNSEDNLYKSQHKFQMTNTDPNMEGYYLYRALMKCPEFQQYYVDHLVAYMGDFLNADTFKAYLDEIWAENEGEQLRSHQKWGEWWSNVEGNINFMRNWITKRGNYMPNLMKYDWSLQTAVDIKVNQDLTDEELSKLGVRYDGVALTRGRFSGKDYKGRTIVLDGNANVSGWRLHVQGTDEVTVDGSRLTYEITGTQPVTINAIVNETGITDISSDAADAIRHDGQYVMCDSRMDVYDLSGRIVATGAGTLTLPAHGIYIVKTADGRTAKVVY